MVIFWTLFESSFQMLWLPFGIQKPEKLSGFQMLWTRLDRSINKKPDHSTTGQK
jgi:hypothetical protein